MYFLLIFFAIYAAMNGYVVGKISFALPELGKLRLLIGAFVMLMVIAPVAVYYIERWRLFRLADVVAVVTYVWMAMVFWFTMSMLLLDAWNLLAWLAGVAAPAARAAIIPSIYQLAVVGVLVVAATVWGLVEAHSIRPVHLQLEVASLPQGRASLRVVQLTDLHLGLHVGQRRLDRIVALATQVQPDILVATGDMFDSPPARASELAQRLVGIPSPMGRFAVLGNHEFYLGLQPSLQLHREAGFTVLRQQGHMIGQELLIAGVDDPAGRRIHGPSLLDENSVLRPPGDRPTTLLLKHQPRVENSSVGRFDLQISGHTHGGQIYPFRYLTAMFYRYYRGWHDLGEGSHLYVSRGAGTWGPPLRLLARPEITVIDLVLEQR